MDRLIGRATSEKISTLFNYAEKSRTLYPFTRSSRTVCTRLPFTLALGSLCLMGRRPIIACDLDMT